MISGKVRIVQNQNIGHSGYLMVDRDRMLCTKLLYLAAREANIEPNAKPKAADKRFVVRQQIVWLGQINPRQRSQVDQQLGVTGDINSDMVGEEAIVVQVIAQFAGDLRYLAEQELT